MRPTHQRIALANLPMYLGYAVSAVTFIAGAAIAFGFLIDVRFPAQFRIMFGVVFMLMGVYRFVLTQAKIRQWKAEDEEDED
jgi:cytochrome c biogenesis protein CcdA